MQEKNLEFEVEAVSNWLSRWRNHAEKNLSYSEGMKVLKELQGKRIQYGGADPIAHEFKIFDIFCKIENKHQTNFNTSLQLKRSRLESSDDGFTITKNQYMSGIVFRDNINYSLTGKYSDAIITLKQGAFEIEDPTNSLNSVDCCSFDGFLISTSSGDPLLLFGTDYRPNNENNKFIFKIFGGSQPLLEERKRFLDVYPEVYLKFPNSFKRINQ